MAGRVEFSGRKMRLLCALLLSAGTVFSLAATAQATHPLITDDPETQGTGKMQLEFLGEYDHEKDFHVTTDSIIGPATPVISYGLSDNTDLVLGTSYQIVRTSDGEGTVEARGISDTLMDLKVRFFERGGLSFALKPGITLPTGDDKKGLGAGKVTYHLYFIASEERGPLTLLFNLGYLRNENTLSERKDLWHVSLAGLFDLAKRLKMVGNIGIQQDPEVATNGETPFVLGGLVYSITESLDLDIGFRAGCKRHETEYAVPAGVTWRF